MALQRLQNTEKRLLRQPDVAGTYRETIRRYLEEGYVHRVQKSAQGEENAWFLPHFPVLRPDKTMTKVRIVFDGSAQFAGTSLNDTIYRGPKLQRELSDVLLRFRKHQVCFTCDIAEMYLRIGLRDSDRPYHRFLWRDIDQEKQPDQY